MNMISPPAVEHVIRVQTGKRLNGYILIIADNMLIVKYKKVIYIAFLLYYNKENEYKAGGAVFGQLRGMQVPTL